jgi:hypothetical protein
MEVSPVVRLDRLHYFLVIPGRSEATSFDVHLHIRESINHDREYGFRACASRRIPE